MADVALLRKVMEHIESHPEEWDQAEWRSPCGATMCFAGHAAWIAGAEFAVVKSAGDRADHIDIEDDSFFCVSESVPSICEPVHGVHRDEQGRRLVPIADYGKHVLGLNAREADQLFRGTNSLDDLRDEVERIIAKEPYDVVV